MTSEQDFPGVVVTTRKNKRGETVPLLQYKREFQGKRFKRNLPGPKGSPAMVRAFDKALVDFEAFKATGVKARLGRDENGKVITKPTTRPEYAARWDTTPTRFESLRWLVGEHLKSAEYLALGDKTRSARERHLLEVCRTPYLDESGVEGTRGDLSFRALELADIEDIQALFRETPGKADNVCKDLSALFAWARRDRAIRLKFNPADGWQRLSSGDGHRAWEDEHRARFEAYWAVGTIQRLAYALLYHTALRRSDAIRVGTPHDKGTHFEMTEFKGSRSRALKRAPKAKYRAEDLVINDELRRIIDATTGKGEMVFVLNPTTGLPFTTQKQGDDNFSRMFCRWARAAGIPAGYSPHGLRKAAANAILEDEGTHADIMSLLGHTTPAEAERYGRKFKRLKGGRRAAGILDLKAKRSKTAKP